MPKSAKLTPMNGPEEFVPPPPSLRLEGDDIKTFLGSKLPAYDDKVSLSGEFRVKEVSDGEDYDGKKRNTVVLELVSGDKKKDTGEEFSDEDKEDDGEEMFEDDEGED